MQLKTGREAWKNSKTGFSQTVGNQFATIANFAISWQTIRNHCEFRNLFATLRNSLAPLHCTFANFASHIKLQKLSEISHCQLRKPLCQLRKPLCQLRKPLCQIRNPLPTSQTTLPTSKTTLPTSQTTLPNSQPIAKFANHLAKLAITLPTSQQHCQIRKPFPNSLALRNSHLQALSSSVINATDFQTW